MVALVGATAPADVADLKPRLAVTERDLAEADPQTDTPLIAMHLGARDPRRRWPVSRFAELADRLVAGTAAEIVLVGGPPDAALTSAFTERCHAPIRDLTGKLSLGATLGVLARSTLFIGNDSGPRHLASAVGIPTLGFFLDVNVPTFGPLVGDTDEVLAASCLTAISVDAAYRRALALLHESTG